jgi:hypothetical protein
MSVSIQVKFLGTILLYRLVKYIFGMLVTKVAKFKVSALTCLAACRNLRSAEWIFMQFGNAEFY